jgi:hypothetical protein
MDVKRELEGLIGKYKDYARDGLSWTEVWSLTTAAVAAFIRVADSADPDQPLDHKAVVLEACAAFYDSVLAPIDIPKVPNLIEGSLVDPALRSLWLSAAEGVYDVLREWISTTPKTEQPAEAPKAPPGFVPY